MSMKSALGSAIPRGWISTIALVLDGRAPRPLQELALNRGLLSSRKNLIVAAPTNSGKSAVGLIALLQGVKRGNRVILVEPLRALAREQTDSLERIAEKLGQTLGRQFKVRITTGDYRLDDEFFTADAPEGELIVATPERLEAILRNPKFSSWFDDVGVVCIDEAHLISHPRRGPTLEYLITSFLCLSAPPRIILLSATLGNVEAAQDWLSPCDVIQISERYPPLTKKIIEVKPHQDAIDVLHKWIAKSLKVNNAQVLVFVYQTASAEKTARELTQKLGLTAGLAGALPYHSKMSTAQREDARGKFLSGDSRVVVTTSALAMGVNLPATHVAVRDLSYPNAESPTIGDLLQMMGRAGRGDQTGIAVVLKKPSDNWNTHDLQRSLEKEELPDFVSAFADDTRPREHSDMPSGTTQVLSLLARKDDVGVTAEQIQEFFLRSFGGHYLSDQIGTALLWSDSHKLSHQQDDGHYVLTRLGTNATRGVLPPPLASGYAQLLRDLMLVDSDDAVLGSWSSLDHLLVLCLLHDRTPGLRPYSAGLVKQVNGWSERHAQRASLLFQRWLRGEKDYSSAQKILGSLGISVKGKSTQARHEVARRLGYRAMFQSIVLLERSEGMSTDHIIRQFGIKNFEGIEEAWRDQMLWLLNGVAAILDIKCFYFHLMEDCKASKDRVKRLDRLLKRMRHQCFDLQNEVKFCSVLGPLLQQMRKSSGGKTGVGIQSIRKLEAAGIGHYDELAQQSVSELVGLGIRKDIAQRIRKFVRQKPR